MSYVRLLLWCYHCHFSQSAKNSKVLDQIMSESALTVSSNSLWLNTLIKLIDHLNAVSKLSYQWKSTVTLLLHYSEISSVFFIISLQYASHYTLSYFQHYIAELRYMSDYCWRVSVLVKTEECWWCLCTVCSAQCLSPHHR